MAAAQLDEQADLARHAVTHQRQPPHCVGARHADIEHVLALVHDEAVGARHGVDQLGELARRVVAIDAAGRIMQPGLALVGEIEIAVGRKEEIVDALEALRRPCLDQRRRLAVRRIEQDDAALVVGDEDAAVLVDFEPVGPAVIFGDQCPFAGRADAEDPAEGNIGDVEIARAVETRPFEEAVELHAGRVGVRPARLALLAELLRDAAELGRRYTLGWPVHLPSSPVLTGKDTLLGWTCP